MRRIQSAMYFVHIDEIEWDTSDPNAAMKDASVDGMLRHRGRVQGV